MKIKADVRTLTGRRGCRKLQAQGFYPAVMYGSGEGSYNIQVNKAVMDVFMRGHPVKTQLFSIEVDKTASDVLVKDIKRSSANNRIQHIDFYQVSRNKEIQVDVPVCFVNEDASKGVIEGGIIDHVMTEVAIKVLPRNLPESLVVDIKALEIGQSIHLSETDLPKGCILQKPVTEEYDPVIVSIHAPKVVVEAVVEDVESEEAEQTNTQDSEE